MRKRLRPKLHSPWLAPKSGPTGASVRGSHDVAPGHRMWLGWKSASACRCLLAIARIAASRPEMPICSPCTPAVRMRVACRARRCARHLFNGKGLVVRSSARATPCCHFPAIEAARRWPPIPAVLRCRIGWMRVATKSMLDSTMPTCSLHGDRRGLSCYRRGIARRPRAGRRQRILAGYASRCRAHRRCFERHNRFVLVRSDGSRQAFRQTG